MKTPVCPKCNGTDFSCSPVKMSNNDFWNPVICSSCGVIVGQIPSKDEYNSIKQLGDISTILERLDNIQTLLYDSSKDR
ncbi:MAG: hypothetical protein LBH16_06260 [Treponema sp.]|nr:hypothetical protein [Treponema sp.]